MTDYLDLENVYFNIGKNKNKTARIEFICCIPLSNFFGHFYNILPTIKQNIIILY